jgi:hypothetical protein
MEPFQPGLTEKDQLCECVKLLKIKDSETFTNSILNGNESSLNELIWQIIKECQCPTTDRTDGRACLSGARKCQGIRCLTSVKPGHTGLYYMPSTLPSGHQIGHQRWHLYRKIRTC